MAAVDSLSASGAKPGFKAIPGIVKDKVVGVAKNASKIGKDDPRKVMHCGKVGLALTLNSLFYYYNPLYDGFGQSGIWAVLTVVVVFEFTVGGTLSKSLNRGFATFSAASLGFGVVYLAQLSGRDEQAMVIGVVVFILAALTTFTRFFPRIKKKYDYGMVIFILTFSMVAVSGYRAEKIMVMSYQRLLTVVIGGATCIIISILVCPAWAGEDLQNLIAGNIEKLAKSLEGFGNAYFCFPDEDDESGVVAKGDDKAYDHQHYKSVLNSKTSEESLATFAWWEIGHGEFRFRHPWKQYLKVGDLARECASHIHALSAYLTSENQAPIEFVKTIKEPCMAMCSESTKALRELSSTLKTMTHPSPAIQTHLQTSKAAIADLRAALQASPAAGAGAGAGADLFSIIPVLAVASILTDIAACVDKISESTEELSVKARFKKPGKADNNSSAPAPAPELQLLHRGTVNPVAEDEGGYAAVAISGTSQDSPEIGNSNPPEDETKKIISKSGEANNIVNKT
ncbi:aluminum-activated malate transporter 8-like [Ipomoea triloba]|uniref:aluminum-activated malate transporter 8-like n=1 Tax=Ipomoea triloba TaxID=35885 RepID=UPI00125CD984|nr:aluminum-activated malate transporter 8-like [Ipomoea triloba]